MRAITGWRHLMASTVSVAARSSLDSYGVPTYATATSYAAHLSRKRRMVRTAEGQEVVSDQAVYLNTSANIQPTAKVTLSTGDVGSTEPWAITPPIVAVERRFDDRAAHSVVLYLGGGA